MFDSVFKRSFNSAKCKTLLRLATSRIKLLRNKREVQLKQMKRELAKLLQAKQEPSAHIRVEHIYREQNIMAAYEIIELLCELIAIRLPIIESQRQCPIDLQEAITSIIFAAPQCSDIPELQKIRNLLSAKYGKEFTAIAVELRPNCGVNRVVIEKLSVRGPSQEVKMKLMKDIAAEHCVDWDPTALESQLFKPPEDLLEGPSQIFGASQMSFQKSFEEPSTIEPISLQTEGNMVEEVKTPVAQNMEFLDERQFIPFVRRITEDDRSFSDSQSTSRMATLQSSRSNADHSPHGLSATSSHKYHQGQDAQPVIDRRESLKGVAAAAYAAAESAERAAAAARAAAGLASQNFVRSTGGSSSDSESDNDGDSESDNNDGDEASQLQARFEDNRLKPAGEDPPDESSIYRRPFFDEPVGLFDEPVEGKGFYKKQTSGNNTFSNNGPIGERSVSHPIFSSGGYSDNDSETALHSTSRLNRHDNDQASRQQLHTRNSSSNNWSFQHNDKSSFRTRSFGTAGATPSFDTYEWGPDNKPADETAQSITAGLPERLPAKLPGAQTPILAKSTSFVHPKLPDYDDLIAQFKAIKAMRSKKG